MTTVNRVQPLSVAVVGTGFGCVTHVRALRAAGFAVNALVGRDPERTAERAQQFGVADAFTSLHHAFISTEVDAVTVATPPRTHAPFVFEALGAGKHVLCEKPFARDAGEARTMLAAAEESGLVHLLGTEFRWDAGQATLARTVARGDVGEPRLALVLMHVPMLADPGAEVPAWWGDASAGGGWLGAHGSQVIDQLRVTLGEFDGVSAALPHVAGRPQSAEDAFVVEFRMRSGCTGVMSSTCGDRGPFLVETRIVGSTGTAWIDGVGDKVFAADADGTRQVPVEDDLPRFGVGTGDPLPPDALHTAYDHMIAHGLDLPPYTRLAETFRDLILGKPIPAEPRPATFADGVAQMEVLDAIRRSAATREWVPIPRSGDGKRPYRP